MYMFLKSHNRYGFSSQLSIVSLYCYYFSQPTLAIFIKYTHSSCQLIFPELAYQASYAQSRHFLILLHPTAMPPSSAKLDYFPSWDMLSFLSYFTDSLIDISLVIPNQLCYLHTKLTGKSFRTGVMLYYSEFLMLTRC